MTKRDDDDAEVQDVERLLHELHVHQIELETQNEELVRSRGEAEAAMLRYSELYDFAPVGYFTLERDGTIRQVNLAGARMLGAPRSGLVARRLGVFVAEGDRVAFNGALTRVFGGEDDASCEVELRPAADAGGAPLYAQFTVSATAGLLECRAVALDVTERRRAEDQLRATQKMDAIGKLAGGIAHDFNSMLTVVLAQCDLTLGAVPEDAPIRQNLNELKAAAERAASLTRQLLAFSRQQVLRPQVIDLNRHVREFVVLLRPALGADVAIALSLAPDLGHVEVDPVQFEQVLMNLAINAREAMPAGGELTISTANLDPPDESGVAVKPGPRVVVSVTDTGAGMDAATIARIFEPFFTTKARGRGLGLGLSTAHGIVKQCGGDLAVRSRIGAGTTFDIHLPRVNAPLQVDPVPVTTPGPPAHGTETVLVVEDEPALRRIASRVLTSAGYTVLLAGSGAEALSVARAHGGRIHLALTDVVMPGMTGVVFAERLRLERPATRILYMSGYTDEALGTRGVLDRETHFLGKPFSPDDLKRKVREVLDSVGSVGVAPS